MNRRNILSVVLSRARSGGNAPGIRFIEDDALRVLSWDEVDGHLRSMILGLDELALAPGTRIGLLARNRWEWIIIHLAASGRGLVTVSLDPGWSDNRTLQVLRFTHAEIIFVETAEQAGRLARLRGELPRLRHIITIEPGTPRSGGWSLEHIQAAGRSRIDEGAVDRLLSTVHPEDVAAVIFTGGSTGLPRGVIRTHANALSAGWTWFPWMGEPSRPEPAPGDVLLNPLSFCHSAGRWGFEMALARSIPVALPSSGSCSLRDIQRLAPTHMIAVPRLVLQLQKLLLPVGQSSADPRAAIRRELGGRLRCIVSGGAPLASDLVEFFEAAEIEVQLAYGSTETGVLAMNRARACQGAGKPVGADLRIQQGEIQVRGACVTPGYLDNDAATAAARTDDGWWRTGDAGQLDPAGCLTITGRIQAMFNCYEGTNIDPTAIEHLLESDRYIREAVLIGHRRPFLVALVVADQHLLEFEGIEDPHAFLQQRVHRLNQRLEDFEKVRGIQLVPASRMAQVRSVTVAQKIRIDRDAVDRVFAAEIEGLYRFPSAAKTASGLGPPRILP